MLDTYHDLLGDRAYEVGWGLDRRGRGRCSPASRAVLSGSWAWRRSQSRAVLSRSWAWRWSQSRAVLSGSWACLGPSRWRSSCLGGVRRLGRAARTSLELCCCHVECVVVAHHLAYILCLVVGSCRRLLSRPHTSCFRGRFKISGVCGCCGCC